MPSYRLQYFPVRGWAEVARQLFALSSTPYEDVRIAREDWSQHKEATPFGQMPVLFVDDQALPQSAAIARYLARQFGFAGKTDIEAALVDGIVDQFKDYAKDTTPFFLLLFRRAGEAEEDKDKVQAEVGEPARDRHMGLLEKLLEKSASGFLVGDSVTWADLLLADHVDVLDGLLPGWFNAFPALLAHRKKIQEIPEINAWLEKRPKTPF